MLNIPTNAPALENVGNVTITDGVATGFAANKYLQSPVALDFTQQDYEISCKFNCTNVNGANTVFRTVGAGMVVFINSSGSIDMYIKTSTASSAQQFTYSSQVSNNQTYSLSFRRKNGSYSLYLNGNLVANLNLTGDIQSNSNGICFGGGNPDQSSQYMQGSIYLKGTFISLNGALIVGELSGAPEKIIIDDGTNQTEANYLVVSDKLCWADKKTYLKGPVGHTIVGKPTIADGIVSGFSTSKYLNLTQAFNPSNKSFEVCIAFITGSNIATEQYMFRSAISAPSQAGRFGFVIGIVNNKIAINSSSNSSSWGTQLIGQTTLSKNTSYVLKTIYDGSSLSATLSTSGGAFATEIPSTSRSPLYNGLTISQLGVYSYGGAYQNPFLGSIDLKATYIIVDGELFFYGKNNSTDNYAFVPSGVTFGGTTTTSAGYVNMNTQQFSPAPTGATWGRDN